MKKTVLLICCIALFCPNGVLYGQTGDADKTGEAAGGPMNEDDAPTLMTLYSIAETMKELKDRIGELEQALRRTRSEEEKTAIEEELARLNARYKSMTIDLGRVIAGVDLEQGRHDPSADEFNWHEELRELLWPVIQELKNMTARPREIERLRSELLYYERSIEAVRNALANVARYIGQIEDQELMQRLEALKKDWQAREHQLTSQRDVAQYKLEEMRRQKTSVVTSAQNIVRSFFRSRGRNFALALLAFLGVLLVFRLVHRIIYRYSPFHRPKRRNFYVRLGDVIYHFTTFLAAGTAMLLVLYGSGDWVLLSLFIVFLLGLLWTARQGLVRFWEQIKLLLNLGTVREDERMVYNGIPWRVASLNVYSHLENPEMDSPRIRLPLGAFIGLNSRPYHEHEPWFPCRLHDWVILSDGTFGHVVSQSPEMVQMVLLGGSRKTYPVQGFLDLAPENISTGFRIRSDFGIDYDHQAESTRQIPETMRKVILEKLEEEKYEQYLISLKVEFKSAGASSLDLEVLADFSGDASQYHNRLERALQRYCVEACNLHGWVIPFTQLTLHNAGE